MMENLPDGWCTTKIGDVVDRVIQRKPNNDEQFFYIDIGSIDRDQKKIETPDFILGKDAPSRARKIINTGDVLVSLTRPNLNAVAYVYEKYNEQIASTGFDVLKPKIIDGKYLFALVRGQGFIESISKQVQGALYPAAKSSDVHNFEFNLPPLAEQQQIAKLLDQHLAQVEQIKARLAAIPALLKKFRQSVLADAVSGKLTENWREDNKIDFTNWTFESADSLCDKVQSGSTPKNHPFDQDGTIPFLKVYNIVGQRISFDYKPQFILESVHQKESKRSICKPNDILMNIVGPPLGKIAIVPNEYSEWNINQAITLFRVNPEKIIYKFLFYVLCEGQLVRDVTHDLKGIVGQVNISLSQCRQATLPKPTIEEQTEIVRRVEQLFAHADHIEKSVLEAQKRVNNLTQSILAKAFSGELTAAWREQNLDLISGDNSAAKLLERIQLEREATSNKAKKTKGVKA